ncbi:MAG: hypothetical protein JETT_1524 [Candidatus Jettenia ecosi]|uniref:Uncharacterized protein n=1 Tax=Candidatus Jettenia ecosi TaxID=2494326 RepID=A0A533QNP1_9BACT|nr:MAG: hypothetical protein JETT_1524 [Candidatus Jettenia ecosi]
MQRIKIPERRPRRDIFSWYSKDVGNDKLERGREGFSPFLKGD